MVLGGAFTKGASLVIAPASTRYADLHELDLRLGLPGCCRIAKRLWRVRDSSIKSVCYSIDEIVVPLARATSYAALLERLAASSVQSCAEPWRLRFEDHHGAAEPDGFRASDYLCGVARYLGGSPAVASNYLTEAYDLVLIRCANL